MCERARLRARGRAEGKRAVARGEKIPVEFSPKVDRFAEKVGRFLSTVVSKWIFLCGGWEKSVL